MISFGPEYPLDGLPLARPEALVAELGKGVVKLGIAVGVARGRVEVWPGDRLKVSRNVR